MPAYPIENPDEFECLINRPEPSIFYFFAKEGDGPGEELGLILDSGAELEAFWVDIDRCDIDIKRDPSNLPCTVLYKGGEELDVADGGNIEKFLELCERWQSEA